MDNTSEPLTMWIMDLEERLGDAESTHHLVLIKILNLLGGSVGTPGSVQFVKSKSYVVLINMELRYRYRQHHETDLTPGLSYPEAQSGMTKMTLPKTVRR